MYIYNVTFIIEQAQEEGLLDYIKKDLLSKLFNPESPAKNPELRKVVEVGGVKPDKDHGLSIALAATFDTEETAHLWHDHILIPALGDFPVKFGPDALFFVTLLENILL